MPHRIRTGRSTTTMVLERLSAADVEGCVECVRLAVALVDLTRLRFGLRPLAAVSYQ